MYAGTGVHGLYSVTKNNPNTAKSYFRSFTAMAVISMLLALIQFIVGVKQKTFRNGIASGVIMLLLVVLCCSSCLACTREYVREITAYGSPGSVVPVGSPQMLQEYPTQPQFATQPPYPAQPQPPYPTQPQYPTQQYPMQQYPMQQYPLQQNPYVYSAPQPAS